MIELHPSSSTAFTKPNFAFANSDFTEASNLALTKACTSSANPKFVFANPESVLVNPGAAFANVDSDFRKRSEPYPSPEGWAVKRDSADHVSSVQNRKSDALDAGVI